MSEPVLRLRKEQSPWREFQDEAIVLDLRNSSYLGANPAATVLWKLLDAGTTRSAMEAALVDAFEITPQRAEVDVENFLADLERRSLLEEPQP